MTWLNGLLAMESSPGCCRHYRLPAAAQFDWYVSFFLRVAKSRARRENRDWIGLIFAVAGGAGPNVAELNTIGIPARRHDMATFTRRTVMGALVLVGLLAGQGVAHAQFAFGWTRYGYNPNNPFVAQQQYLANLQAQRYAIASGAS